MWYWGIYHKLLKVTTLTLLKLVAFGVLLLCGCRYFWVAKIFLNLQYMYVPAIWVGSSRLDRVVSCGQENLRGQYRKL